MDDFKETISGVANDAWDWASNEDTWNNLKDQITEAGGNIADWSKETWFKTSKGAECLKDAMEKEGSEAKKEAALECRKTLKGSAAENGGINVATFNTFLGAGIAIFIFARAA